MEDALGRVLEEHIVSGERVLDPSLAYQVVDMMQDVIDNGTGQVVRKMGFQNPAAGKTGTTNGYKGRVVHRFHHHVEHIGVGGIRPGRGFEGRLPGGDHRRTRRRPRSGPVS